MKLCRNIETLSINYNLPKITDIFEEIKKQLLHDQNSYIEGPRSAMMVIMQQKEEEEESSPNRKNRTTLPIINSRKISSFLPNLVYQSAEAYI